jgi:type VI secretion system protein ImpF
MYAFRESFRKRDAERTIDTFNDAGERVLTGRRSSPRSAVAEPVLRGELSEDVSALLNTVNFGSAQDLAEFAQVRRSILNYGVPDLASVTSGSLAAGSIAVELKTLLEAYEQRLVPGSVTVRTGVEGDDASGLLRFHISAEMHSTPADVAIEFVAEVETGSGKVRVSKL